MNPDLLRQLVVLSSVTTLLFSSPASAERKRVRVDDGITVEEQSVEGRTLPILFGTTTMAASPQQIAAWVGAVHTYVGWQHNCEEARVLQQPDGTLLTYYRVGSPWPVSDRDVVLRSKRADMPDRSIRLDFRSVETKDAPSPRGVVRMPQLVGSYDLKPIDGGTHVVYTVDSDPGGTLPTWLVREASKDLPFFTLKNLRARAESGLPPASP